MREGCGAYMRGNTLGIVAVVPVECTYSVELLYTQYLVRMKHVSDESVEM